MHIARLVVLMALVGFPGGLIRDAWAVDAGMARFAAQHTYGYCDAKLIAGLWATSVAQTKAAIGDKLASGQEAQVQAALAGARQQARAQLEQRPPPCTYQELGYSFADISALSRVWGQDTGQTKLTVERKFVIAESRDFIDAALALARQAPSDPLTAFLESPYGYCDAAALAAAWGLSFADAKTTIGHKILAGGGDLLPPLLASAKEQVRRAGGIPHCPL